ncbi:MAG: hypothetical protein AAF636_27605 [Pseudomonadota bacterium]
MLAINSKSPDPQAIIEGAIDRAIETVNEGADMRPVTALVAILDAAVARCGELDPGATASIMRVHSARLQETAFPGSYLPEEVTRLPKREAELVGRLTQAAERRVAANG